MKFSEIRLHPVLQANLDKIQFIECTPIQEQAIPLLRKGKDISGLAQTGTGKTGAFLVPLIDRLLKAQNPDESVADSETVPFPDWKKRQFVLVLVPTRELCEQVQDNARKFLEGTGLSSVSVYGGTTYDKQIAALKQGVEFVIATPGRFIDLYKEHVADLSMVRAVVFDEADRMFDMGFKDDMKFILKRIPRDRQFLVFSATLNFEVLNVAYENGADPVEINISRNQAKADNVKDYMLHLGQTDKPRYLLSLLKKHEPRQTIIFSNFKHNVERIAKFLNANSVPAMGISSLLTQAQRNRVMEQFKAENEKNILVATDVAARGLDILGVDLVINFDLPDDPENYVHRVGRTGRAGQMGQAFSLVGDRDVDALQRIEEFLKNKLEVVWMDDTELVKEFQQFPRDEGRRGPPSRGRFEGRQDRPQRGGGRERSGSGGGRDRSSGPSSRPRPRPQEGRSSGPSREPDSAVASGPARETHRDRNRGRQRDSSAGGQERQNASGPRQPQRPHQQGSGGGRNRRPQSGPQAHRSHSNGRPAQSHSRPRITPRGTTPPVAPKTIGKKITGLFKRIFGK